MEKQAQAMGQVALGTSAILAAVSLVSMDREMQRWAPVNGAAPTRVSPTPQAGVDLRDLTMAAGPFAGQNAYEVY